MLLWCPLTLHVGGQSQPCPRKWLSQFTSTFIHSAITSGTSVHFNHQSWWASRNKGGICGPEGRPVGWCWQQSQGTGTCYHFMSLTRTVRCTVGVLNGLFDGAFKCSDFFLGLSFAHSSLLGLLTQGSLVPRFTPPPPGPNFCQTHSTVQHVG